MNGERDTSVFINCPYDPDYEDIFDALLFAAVICGFYPKSAMTPRESAKPRMERIAQTLRESKYSFHDLSRCKGGGDENLARFNMPLELGIAMGLKYFANDEADGHDWCLLVLSNSDYRRFVSDLAGYDPKEYDGHVDGAVQALMSWLSVTQDATMASVNPRQVLNALPEYRRITAQLRADWGSTSNVPWEFFVNTAIEVAQQNALLPQN